MAHVQRRTWAFVILGCAVFVGCAAIAGIEDTTTVPDALDATTADAVPDLASPDGTTPEDAGAEAGEPFETPDAAKVADASACAAQIQAVKAEALPNANGVVCGDPNRVLGAGNTLPVGLDYDPNGPSLATRWGSGGAPVHGCVGVQFDAGLTSVVVRARMVDSACGQACSGTGCNSLHYYGAWLRVPDGGMELVDNISLEFDTLTDTVVQLADGGVVMNPYVAICRTSLAIYREDIDLRYVGGCP